jgi:hypothetical protein
MNKHEDFNKDQIKPVLSDLHIAHGSLTSLLYTLNEYVTLLEEIITIVNRTGKITHAIIIKIDKNVYYILNELNISVNKSVTLNNYGIARQKIFDRLEGGITYKYKLNNGCLFDNPEIYPFDNIIINVKYRTIKIGDIDVQLSDESDYFPDNTESGYIPDPDLSDAENVILLINKIKIEETKTKLITAIINNYLKNVDFIIEVTNVNIKHFNLF